MDSQQSTLADYIICLSESAARTHHANDRPLYGMYLADAAMILAMLVKGCESTALHREIERHERLWGQTWLVGPELAAIRESWQRFKTAAVHTT